MEFGKVHFGSIVIDDVIYAHDVVIDRARSSSARRNPRSNFASSSDTLPCRLKRSCLGNANVW
jgi:hypothetical protein